jgi:hypothetical protein
MTPDLDPAIWDDLFHGCSVAAFSDLLAELGRPPESEEHRQRASAYYEQELARKNRDRTPKTSALRFPGRRA